jgi:hypothetical protein
MKLAYRLHRRRVPLLPPLPPVDPERPSRPCIVHLVRAANGPAPFQSFLDAVGRNPPGIDCDFVLAMKGFAREDDAEPYLKRARHLSPDVLFFSDEGLDLGVYFDAAAQLRRDRYCFVNSYSEPLVASWLAKLDAALAQPRVGLVGATGSWASTRSWVAYSLRLPSAYRGVLPSRRIAREAFASIDLERSGIERPSRLEALLAKLRVLGRMPEQILAFESFPAYHIRTNAFMIAHSTLVRLGLHAVHDKFDAYLLENGRRSITRQVQSLGLRTLVVDRDGNTYDPDHWYLSRTLWQGAQEGLLLADNQTRSYASGDVNRRRLLSGFAWGRLADSGESASAQALD